MKQNQQKEIQIKALACIKQYGKFRWCPGGICACLGCANRTMTREEYTIACTLPGIAEVVEKQKLKDAEDRIKRKERIAQFRSSSIPVMELVHV